MSSIDAIEVDVVVVGGGVMGSATAWELSTRGARVVLVEQFGPGHTKGSSHGRTRVFRTSYRDPLYVHLALDALPRWRRLENETGIGLLEQRGQIDHGDAVALDEIEVAMTAAGRAVERLTSVEAARRWPGFAFDGDVLHSPDGGLVRADDSVAALQSAAAGRGVTIHHHLTVGRIEVVADDCVDVAAGPHRWRATSVVVAAGAWAAPLVGPLAPLPPLQVTVTAPSHFRPTIDDAPWGWPSFLHHLPGDGPLAFGAYGVFAPGVGMKVGVESPMVATAPDAKPDVAPAEILDSLVRYVRRWFPGLDPAPLDPHTCLFTSTADEHFVIDRCGPVVVCSPCSGHGFKFAPAIGALAAELALAPAGARQATPQWRLPDPI